MPIYKGSQQIYSVHFGASGVGKVRVGTTLVFGQLGGYQFDDQNNSALIYSIYSGAV